MPGSKIQKAVSRMLQNHKGVSVSYYIRPLNVWCPPVSRKCRTCCKKACDLINKPQYRSRIVLGDNWYTSVAHEYGHHLIYLYGLKDNSVYKRYFSSGRRVHVSADLKRKAIYDRDNAPPHGKITWFACLSPEEDFCECVERLVKNMTDPKKRMFSANGDRAAQQKLMAVWKILKIYAEARNLR